MIISIITALVGLVIGYVARLAYTNHTINQAQVSAKQLLVDAREESSGIVAEGNKRADAARTEFKKEVEDIKKELREDRTEMRDREKSLTERTKEIEMQTKSLAEQEQSITKGHEELESKRGRLETDLEKIAELTADEARAKLMKEIEVNYAEDLQSRMQKVAEDNNEQVRARAQEILVSAMQRVAMDSPPNISSVTVPLPSEDIKGKIIGREGRNIRSFEQISGTEVMIDDAQSLTISSFDPIRRQVARVALENLISDGRIQPAKIEEYIKKAQDEINVIVRQKGQDAVKELGILNLDPRLISILGRLHFRTSYGQNVLHHSIETAHIATMLATELGIDVEIAKVGALVHDIGKALDHEVQGTHVQIGIRILEKFNADPAVIIAMKSHHDDWPHESPEAVVVQVADSISASRPGARRDSLERYVKRLEDLEHLASEFPGVNKVYAISAGRELRIFVSPDQVTDIEATRLARNIAKKIEQELRYPGEIKITLIRENRVIEYAR